MCTITATELKSNLGKYIELSQKEDIYITKNGKPYAKLTSATKSAFDDFMSLAGIFKDSELTIEDTRLDRLKK